MSGAQAPLAWSVLVALGVLLGGCVRLFPPAPVEEPPSPPPTPPAWLIAEETIRAEPSERAIAHVALWMDGDPTRPRIVLQALEKLEFFELHLALPTCYAFPRPEQEMPAWRGLGLEAGARIEIPSVWEVVSQRCTPYATLRWDLASLTAGARGRLEALWVPPT